MANKPRVFEIEQFSRLLAERAKYAREIERIDRQMEHSLSVLAKLSAGPKFDFYEKVRVSAAKGAARKLKGRIGSILGRSVDSKGRWGYAVAIEGSDTCWDFLERDLEATGEFGAAEDFYDGASVRVGVDRMGKGRVHARRRKAG